MSEHFWLGDNELVIVFRKGTYSVLEAYENYEVVFTGNYNSCRDFCENRKQSYLYDRFLESYMLRG